MTRRWVRVLVLLLTVAVTAYVVWRATTNEQARGRMRMASQQTDVAAANLLFELADLRATLYAYVAPGQGSEFWTMRAQGQVEGVRSRLRDLEPAAVAANFDLAEAGSALDRLASAERRARAAVRDELPLIAGDVIFSEARQALDEVSSQVSDARQAMARASSSKEAGGANEQSLLAGALMAVWIFALILLLPVPTVSTVPTDALAAIPARTRGEEDGLQLQGTAPALPAVSEPQRVDDPVPPTPAVAAEPVPEAGAPLPEPVLTAELESLAALCQDLGRVSDVGDLTPLLSRASTLLGARGVVVWLAAVEGHELVPAVAHGYDPQLLARMGAIPVEAHNLTAAAFRSGEPTRAAAAGETPGAVAVPLLSASGATGVLAAELPTGVDLDRAAAVARVLAAQLAGLFATPAASGEPPQHAHA